MNDLVPYKPLSYEEQLDRTKEMMKGVLSSPVVKLDVYRQIKDVQSKLRDRIKKQREEKEKK